MNHPNNFIIIWMLSMMLMSKAICNKNNETSSNTLNSYSFYYPVSAVETWLYTNYTINPNTAIESKKYHLIISFIIVIN